MMQVVQMPQYQQWMAGFGTSTKQVVLNCEAVPSAVTLPSPATLQVSQVHSHAHLCCAHVLCHSHLTWTPNTLQFCLHLHLGLVFTERLVGVQIKLNCIDPKAFPLPQTLGPDNSSAVPSEAQLQQTDSISRLQGSNLLRYNLRPASRVDTVETAEQSLSIPAIQGQLKTGAPWFCSITCCATVRSKYLCRSSSPCCQDCLCCQAFPNISHLCQERPEFAVKQINQLVESIGPINYSHSTA